MLLNLSVPQSPTSRIVPSLGEEVGLSSLESVKGSRARPGRAAVQSITAGERYLQTPSPNRVQRLERQLAAPGPAPRGF